jgi:hypothetical protein
MPDYNYSLLREDDLALIGALRAEMGWTEDDATAFLNSERTGRGREGAIEMLQLRERSRHAATAHREAIADLVHAALA